MEVTQVLDLLAAFRKNLEGVVMLLRGGVFEYRKPIAALMYHEQQALEKIRTLILRDIRRLELVAYRGGSLDSATWQLANELRGGRTPACWLALLRLGGASGTLGWSLEKFQQLLLDRLNTFASWQEPKGDSYKLQLSMFTDVECVFEAVHQHFIRNHVGSALCSSDCLKVVSMFEDSPRLTLPAKEDVIYLTGKFSERPVIHQSRLLNLAKARLQIKEAQAL
ncbi:hypothetical protein PF005_g1522 [Phytophthora fragariae]|uniref:Uncharacterized protein n=1 Tax=Phytophthora fragariae TaxID=53985 RepID=A0A6A3ZH90_9STRA|nr:hypothetical protein PF003_g5413 [Phytophthora fragariae]KAE8948990.1 hypothetical protein PF009_g1422 [Phytophthora fragariae]KAE9137916.1 hypothetical protein PF010_g1144 [Phytophthora fragariae]KAE9138685.1 hypothetical protein PF007_g1311 [Phytophthora fragariae]KAE9231490.1 hypothetical protein PF004_g10209 [Phytophthora fragariae]